MQLLRKSNIKLYRRKNLRKEWTNAVLCLFSLSNGKKKIAILKDCTLTDVNTGDLENYIETQPKRRSHVHKVARTTCTIINPEDRVKKTNSPFHFVLTLKINAYTAYTMAFPDCMDMSMWIDSIGESVKNTSSYLQWMFRSKFWRRTKSGETSIINHKETPNISSRPLEANEFIEMPEHSVYCISSDPTSSFFENAREATIAFLGNSLSLKYTAASTPKTLLFNYETIKRYGSSKNTFCVEISPRLDLSKEFTKSQTTILYFTVDQEAYLEKKFKKKVEEYLTAQKSAINSDLTLSATNDVDAKDSDKRSADRNSLSRLNEPRQHSDSVFITDSSKLVQFPASENSVDPNSLATSYIHKSFIVKEAPQPNRYLSVLVSQKEESATSGSNLSHNSRACSLDGHVDVALDIEPDNGSHLPTSNETPATRAQNKITATLNIEHAPSTTVRQRTFFYESLSAHCGSPVRGYSHSSSASKSSPNVSTHILRTRN